MINKLLAWTWVFSSVLGFAQVGEMVLDSDFYEVSEAERVLKFQVLRLDGKEGPLEAGLRTVQLNKGGANEPATSDVDFEKIEQIITFPDGSSDPIDIQIRLDDDTDYEGDEYFGIELVKLDGSVLGDPSQALVLILDDEQPEADPGQIQFESALYNVNEADDSISIGLIRKGGTEGDIKVTVFTQDPPSGNPAKADSDYGSIVEDVVFASGDAGPIYVKIGIIDDQEVEPNEQFAVSLEGDSAIIGTPANALVVIADNDVEEVTPGQILFESTRYSVNEADGSVTIGLVREGGSDGDITVAVSTQDPPSGEPAEPDVDYETIKDEVTFASGETGPLFVKISIADDSEPESNEQFVVSLDGEASTIGSPANTLVVITDNDEESTPGQVLFESALYNVNEADGSVTIGLVREGGSDGEIAVAVATQNPPSGDPATPNADYETIKQEVTFAPGETGPLFVKIGIADDDEPELPEAFAVSLDGDRALIGSPANALVVITDNDERDTPGQIRFESALYEVNEADGSVTIGLVRGGGSNGDLAVTVSTQNPPSGEPAEANVDYETIKEEIIFASGETGPLFVKIGIADDDEPESNEQFAVSLDGAALGTPSNALVVIADNDEQRSTYGRIRLTSNQYRVTEAEGSVEIGVERYDGVDGLVAVEIATREAANIDPAKPGSDFAEGSEEIFFKDGEGGVVNLSLPIFDDNEPENVEGFEVFLTPIPTANNKAEVELGTPDSALVVIADDDEEDGPGQVRFSSPLYSVLENAGWVDVMLERLGGSAGELNFVLATRDFIGGDDVIKDAGPAESGVDFSESEIKVSFGDGDDEPKTISILILDDEEFEDAEMFGLLLFDETGERVSDTLIRIEDDEEDDGTGTEEGFLAFDETLIQVDENSGFATLSISRRGSLDEDLVAVLITDEATREIIDSTTGFQANAEDDFGVIKTEVVLKAGDPGPILIDVDIVDDREVEQAEIFLAQLIDSQTDEVIDQAGVVILDDDKEDIGEGEVLHSFYEDIQYAYEDEGPIKIEIVREGDLTQSTSVLFRTVIRSGSATADEDYKAVNQEVSFQPGEEYATVEVSLINDDKREPEEFFFAVLLDPTDLSAGALSDIEVIILDDDSEGVEPGAGTLRLSSDTYSVNESDGFAKITVIREGSTEGTLQALLFTDEPFGGDEAEEGEDYEPGPFDIVFAAGEGGEKVIQVPIIDDNEGDPPKVFFVGLYAENDSIIREPSSAVVEITDNDPISLAGDSEFLSDYYSVGEGDGVTRVGVIREEGSQGTLEVYYITLSLDETDQFFANPGVDFDPVTPAAPGKLTFADGEIGPLFIEIPIVDDSEIEGPEGFAVVLFDPGNPDDAEFAAVEINDNDFPEDVGALVLVEDVTPVREDSGLVQIKVERLGGNMGPLTANVSTIVNHEEDDYALENTDFTPVVTTITFEDGEAGVKTFQIPILDDTTPEEAEGFGVLLSDPVQGTELDFQYVVILDNDGAAAFIVEPRPEQGEFFSGKSMAMIGSMNNKPEGSSFDWFWEICDSRGNCDIKEGKETAWTPPEPATYFISCIAVSKDGEFETSPDVVTIRALERSEVKAQITQPSTKRVVAAPGQQFTFRGSLSPSDATGSWFFLSDPDTVIRGSIFQHTFTQSGDFTLIFKGETAAGDEDTDFVNIRVGAAPEGVQINQPGDNATVQVGDVVQFSGEVQTTPSKMGEFRVSWVISDGRELTGLNPRHTFTEAGLYEISFLGLDGDEARFEDSILLYVEDKRQGPKVDFNFPTDLEIRPGGEVFFKARIVDNRGFKPAELKYFWDFGASLGKRNLPSPGKIRFDQEGDYTVSLFARSESGLKGEVVTRTIRVRETADSNFEPNEDLSQASTLSPGSYENLLLDESSSVDYYKFTINSPGQRMVLNLNMTGIVTAEVFDANSNMLETRTFQGQENLQLAGLAPGDYFVKFSSTDQDALKRKASLSYSITLEVLNPALFLPDIQVNESFDTQIGLVNTTGDTASVELLGYDNSGNLVGNIQLELPTMGRSHQSVGQLFGADASRVTWVQVDSTRDLVGYSRTESRDFKEVYGVSANKLLRSELFVPHIAERTEQWYTRANVINGINQTISSQIQAPNTTLDLNVTGALSKDGFDFEDRFGGDIPATESWAILKETSQQPALAGNEIFGLKDPQFRTVAGLQLADVRQDNPNFTYLGNNLYFTHVARRVEQFWTGISLVNIGSSAQGVRVIAYGDGGAEIGRKEFTMQPNEKIVQVAEEFLVGIGSPANVDWFVVEADLQIVGYELFGTHDFKKIAGLEATTGLATSICYPFIDISSEVAHGISVVNVNADPQDVIFNLIDDQGKVLASVTKNLNGHQKFTDTIEAMFSSFNFSASQAPGWLEVRGSAPLAGFELFLNTTNDEQMGALIAQ